MRWLKFTAAGQTSWGIIEGDKELRAELAQTPLEGSDLRWPIASWGELF